MKIVLMLFLCFLIFSCAGTPEPDDSMLPPEQVEMPVVEETAEEPPVPEVLLTELLPSEEPLVVAFFDEPKIEFSETDLPATVPEESPVAAALPEPAAPVEEPVQPPAAAPVVQNDPEPIQSDSEPAQVSPPVAVEPPAQTPPPPRQPVFPPPPALLGPAEERPPAAARLPADRPQPEGPAVSFVRETPPAAVQTEAVNYSRTVRATVGQIVEIPFRGTGWVYLGELASRRGIVYDSRRLDPEGQTFMFRTEAAGTYSLKFYKQDFIRDYILNDFVQVIVGEAPVAGGAGWFNPPFDRGRVAAEPRWPTALDEAELQRGAGSRSSTGVPPVYTPSVDGSVAPQGILSVPAAGPQSGEGSPPAQPPVIAAGDPPVDAGSVPGVVPETFPPVEGDTLPPEALLQKAKETFDGGNTAAAIVLLDQYREYYPSGSDEVYWLYGQFYEANTPARDILAALDYYRRLVREYPLSSRYNDARRRIAYLERFYINIQ